MRWSPKALLGCALFASSAAKAYGCPYCDSAIGRAVRSAIFDGEFFWNAALVGLPIVVLLAVAAAVRFAPLSMIENARREGSPTGGSDR